MSLKETLEDLKRAEEQRNIPQSDKPKLIKEWQDSVNVLYDSIQEYLNEFVSIGLSFDREQIELSEESLGSYPISKLTIHAPSKTIILTPIGRIIVGGIGRVDMHVRGKAFSDEIIRLVRRTDDNTNVSSWIISSPPVPAIPARALHFGPLQFVPLNKETIESAIDSLLR